MQPNTNGAASPTTNPTTSALALYAKEQVNTLRNTVAKGATDAELSLFLEYCRARGLDPFTKQVHWTSKGIITGIDGLRSQAEDTGEYLPGPTRYETNDKGALVAAFVTVRKWVRGEWHDLEESAYLSEYQGSAPIWKEKPRVMLAKCAEARALRRAFPRRLGGQYTSEELDRANEARDVTPRGQPATPPPEAPKEPTRALESPRVVTGTVETPATSDSLSPAESARVASSPPPVSVPEMLGEAPSMGATALDLLARIAKATSMDDLGPIATDANAAKRSGKTTDAEHSAIKVAVQKAREGFAVKPS